MLTFLFTDLAGSTALWERHPEAMKAALAEHDGILRSQAEAAGGQVVKTTGDGLMAVFERAEDGVRAAVAGQRGLRDAHWGETGPLLVRMGLHVGEAEFRAGDWYGTPVNRAARVMAAAHGGQVVVTEELAAAADDRLPTGTRLRDLGVHRLRDLSSPGRLLQVEAPDLQHAFPPLATLDVRPNNLPTQTSVFLGRDDVLRSLRDMLDDAGVRLVTLVGPGGTGKTRLALQAAASQVDRFDDGTYFVDLSDVREPSEAWATVARLLPDVSVGEDAPLEAVKRALRDCQAMLLLDNLEQVTSAAADIAALLAHCPRIEVLATSREALRVRGERLFPVPPMGLPSGAHLSADNALSAEAVRLFAQRASAQQPDFAVTDENANDVAAICSRLDGLPLAIELAAARIRLFSVSELRARLEQHLDVLVGGARDLPERQQTLRAAIEWSNALLTDDERVVMCLFSVFASARLEDVEATAARVPRLDSIDVLSAIESLLDKSLLRRLDDTAGVRFTMLQTIRDFAAEQRERFPDDAATMRLAHADHYTELAATLRAQLAIRERDEVLDAIEFELGNLRTAWTHWVDTEKVVRLNDLLEPLWGYFDAKGDYRSAVELANDLLAVLRIQPESPERAHDEIALEMSLARSLVVVRGYTKEVEASIRDAVERLGDASATQRFPVLRSLATLHMLRSDYQRGGEVGREMLAIAERESDSGLLADAHFVVGVNSAFVGETDDGLRHLDESIRLFDPTATGLVQFRVGPSPGVSANAVSGLLLWMHGFPERARLRVERSLELARALNHPYSLAYALHHASLLDLWGGDVTGVRSRANELHQVASAYDYPIWQALALVLRGVANCLTDHGREGLEQLEEGFKLYENMTTPPVFWPALLMLRATAFGVAGRPQEAAAFIDEAESVITADDPQRADLAITRSHLLLAAPEPDVARATAELATAVQLSRDLGVRMSELTAATLLARLQRGTPDEETAMEGLREVYESFTEGFDLLPLVEARAVLDA